MKKHEKFLVSCLALMIGATALIPSRNVLADGDPQAGGSGNTDAERLYCIGSVSKVYVTTAVMQLADKGLVDIDAPITDYIPNFKMADPRYTKITVRMLMNHTSGILGTQFGNMELYNDNSMVSMMNSSLHLPIRDSRQIPVSMHATATMVLNCCASSWKT